MPEEIPGVRFGKRQGVNLIRHNGSSESGAMTLLLCCYCICRMLSNSSFKSDHIPIGEGWAAKKD